MRFRAPAIVMLRRAQLTLILAALIPTIVLTPVGVVLLASDASAVKLVGGVLVLAFCTAAITGYVLGTIFLSRGTSYARVQNDFLSAVSHELMTPITSIRMFVETLRDERVSDPEERKRCLDILGREMERLESLVSRLLELSRMESGRHLFAMEPVAVDDVVGEAVTALRAATLDAGADVVVELDLEPGLTVLGDRVALVQALGNLLTNAWKYGGDDKRIRIEARARDAREVEIAVADRGPGVPRDEQRRIFQKFERGRAAIDQRTAGSGLGLAVVHEVARAHRGKVELDPEYSDGARFILLLRRPPARPAR